MSTLNLPFCQRPKFLNTVLSRILFYTFLMILSPMLLNAALVTWTGGGAANDWNDPLNWDVGVPTATDDVVITGSSQTVTLAIAFTVESVEIQSGATLIIANTGVLNLGNDDGVDTNGALDLSSSSGFITNNGTINITNASEDGIDSRGTFTNNGTIAINTYTDDGITASKMTSIFTNNGIITITDPTSMGEVGIVVREGAKLNNSLMASIDLNMIEEEGIWVQETDNATVNNSGAITIANIGSGDHGIEVRSTFNNLTDGTIKITNLIAGSGDGVRVEDHMPGIFNNAGTLIIDIDPANTSDAIENQGTFTSTGTIETGCLNGTNELEINGNPNPITFGGCVNFDIAGTSTGSDEFDQIQPKGGNFDITGATAKLDWGTYIPSIGDCFKIVDGSSTVVGPFANITTTNSSIIISTVYSGDEVEICVTAIASCASPINLNVVDNNPSADLSWDPVSGAVDYNWIVVAAGTGPGGTAIASGNTTSNTASATGLTPCDSYDLHVQTDCGAGALSAFSAAYNFTLVPPMASSTTSGPLGTGTSSSATRGPFQRSDSNSSSVYSRANLVYTQAEVLTTLGISAGSTISEIQWDLGSTNIITASGNATLDIYMKNSSATAAVPDTWANIFSGQSLVGTYTYNTTNNFPGAKGYVPFPLATPFVYTGGTIEIAVEWNCSGLMPADITQPNLLFDGNGSLNWRWDNTAHISSIYRAGSSSFPSDLSPQTPKTERVNTQFVYTLPAACSAPVNLNATSITDISADLSWDPVSGASSYNWVIVAAGAGPGGTPVASGTSSGTMVSVPGLANSTSYDFYVEADCGSCGSSGFSMVNNFTTQSGMTGSFPCNGTALGADSALNTYGLITSVLGPSGNPIEVPDCGHTSFGPHITQAFDPFLMKDVFQFHIHLNEDDDRCINFDRQRNEIKTYNNSPANLLGVLGETVQYTWKFKLDAGFQASSKFTHIHQLKSVGATNNEDSMPQITFTLRKGSPDQFELRYAEDFSQITWAQTDLTPFKGQWVEVTETVTYGDWGQGIYTVDIVQLSSGTSLLSYTNSSTRMWKTNASFIRPKWGIYRSIEDAQDLRDEIVCFADFCIDEVNPAIPCANPITYLNATNITSSTVDLSWGGVAGASSYNWKLVLAGGGPGGIAVASGSTPNTNATATGLTPTTSYDLYVTADCGSTNATGFNFSTTVVTTEVCTTSIGTGTSSSSSRGPIHQAGTSASTRYSRYLQIYTQAELAAVGLTANSTISELQWFITTSDVISQGSAPLSIYIKNSSATQAVQGTWSALTAGSTLALNTTMDLTNNFLGSSGWMPFTLNTPFLYTGGALEVAVEFNWASAVFTNNGSAKWRYTNVADDLMVRALGTAGYSTNLTYSTTSKQRANMQICYEPPVVTCPAPSNLNASNITVSSADISWDPVTGASSYTWIIVEAGTGPGGAVIASGNTTNLSASVADLTCLTTYDLHVQADCGGGDVSLFSPAFSFVTLPGVAPTVTTIGTGTISSSSRGPIQQGGGTTTTRYSRFNQVFTQAELAAAGLLANCLITEVQWNLATTDVIAGSGDAPFKVYIKNSSATQANVESWSTVIAGLTPVVSRVFNTTNNFPGVTGWMPFTFNAPFVYTGGAIEIAVEWDYGSVSIPAFTGADASNPNGKSIKWFYSDFGNNVVVRRLGSGSHGTSNLSYSTGSTLPSQRANIQFVHVPESDISFTVDTSSSPSDCGLSNGTASATPSGSGSFSYLWSNGATGATISGLSPGSYTVTVTQSPSGCPVVETVHVGVTGAILWVDGFPAAIDETCAGENDGIVGALATGGNAPYTYTIEDAAGNTLSSNVGLAPGTYFVTATDANGCTVSGSTTVNPGVTLNWMSGPNAVNTSCAGNMDGSVSALAGGGTAPYTYEWEDSNGNPVFFNDFIGNGSNSTSILAPGMYCVTATDDNGCTISGCVTILDGLSTLSWSIAPSATDESCLGNNDGSVAATATGGVAPITYAWTNAAGNVTASSGLPAGTYTVVATDANGCTVSGTTTVAPGESEYTMANNNMLTGVQAVTEDYEVDGAIESDQLVTGGAAVNVDYDSGMCITLKPGFEVANSTVFHAFIDGCGGSMLRENEGKALDK